MATIKPRIIVVATLLALMSASITIWFVTVGAQAVNVTPTPMPLSVPLLPTIPPAPGQTCNQQTGTNPTTTPGNGACGVRLAPAAPQATNVRLGTSAIQPKNATTDALTPTFREADVIQYITTTHTVGKNLSSQGAVTVASVQFVTADKVKAQVPTSIQVPDGQLLCLATVKGVFPTTGAPITDANGNLITKSVINHTMFYVFDAHSGDLLSYTVAP